MFARQLTHPLDAVDEAELARLVRVADPLLAGRPLLSAGHRPNRLRAGQGYEFLDHQEYVPGDDLRNLDWRATARSRRPQLRRFRDEQTADWHICLDTSASMAAAGGHKWQLAVQLTAAMTYLLLHLGNRVGVLTFAEDMNTLLAPGRGRTQYARLAQLLRGTTPPNAGGQSNLLRCLQRLPPRNPVIVISDFLAPDAMQGALTRLLASGRTLHTLHVVDEAELQLPAGGDLVTLQDAESGQQATLPLTAQQVDAATARFTTLQTTLQQFAHRQGMRHTRCPTADTWKTAVLRHLQGLKASDG